MLVLCTIKMYHIRARAIDHSVLFRHISDKCSRFMYISSSHVQIIVQPGSLTARNYQSLQKSLTDLGFFKLLRPNLDYFGHFWTKFGLFWWIIVNFWHFWTESFKALVQDARKARIDCRSAQACPRQISGIYLEHCRNISFIS